MNDQGRPLDWNDTVEQDGGEFTLLPPGEYDFRVLRFERGQFNGSAKLDPCNQVTFFLQVIDPATGAATEVRHNLIMHSRLEFRISQFFAAIGLKKKGQKLQINEAVHRAPGLAGKAKLGIRKWIGNDGSERESNEVTDFIMPLGYDSENNQGNVLPSAPGGFTPGRF